MDACAKFEDIPSRYSSDIMFTKMKQTEWTGGHSDY